MLSRIKRKIRQFLPPPTAPKRIVGYSDAMWDIVAKDASIERIATGFTFTEGPVWLRSRSALYFSDIPRNTIYEWRGGSLAMLRHPSRHANGNSLDHDGRLVTCEHSGRQVSRTEQDGSVSVLANSWGRKRLNSPNDLIVKSDGSIYFTDPPFGIKPDQQELDFSGIYKIDPERGLLLQDASMPAPNGLAFSLDETLLYVDDSERKELRVFDVASDGSLKNGRLAVDMDNGRPGNPDGMKLDKLGNLYVTGPGGIWILSPNMEQLGMIELPEIPSNCAWGEDGRSLFVTARRSVYRIRCRIGGELLTG